MLVTKTLADLRSVLLEPPDNLVDEAYFVIRDNKLLRGSEPNITIIPPHQIGHEYPKTFGHYHEHGEQESYRILYGQAGLLIQKPKISKACISKACISKACISKACAAADASAKNDYSTIEDVKLLKGKLGDQLTVPPGYGHCLINLGREILITADWESAKAGHLYDKIKKLHGFCYYIVRENDELRAIRNQNYKFVPELNII